MSLSLFLRIYLLALFVINSAPVIANSAPVIANSAPVIANSVPVIANSVPVIANSAPVILSEREGSPSRYTLKEIEVLFLKHNYEIQLNQNHLEIAEINKNAQLSSLLPKIDSSWQWTQSEMTSFQRIGPELSISETIPFPPKWQKEYELKKHQLATQHQENQLSKASALSQARKSYFRVQLLSLRLEKSQEKLKLLKQVYQESQSRYQRGFLQFADHERARLQVLDAENELFEGKSSYSLEKLSLAQWSGLEQTEFELSNSLGLSPQWEDPNFSPSLNVDINKHPRLALKYAKKTESQLKVDLNRYLYLPSFDLRAQIPLFQEDRNTRPVLTAGLSWNIFNGLQDRSQIQRDVILLQNASLEVDREHKTINLEIQSLWRKILSLREKYIAKKKMQSAWLAILDLTRKRFNSGEVSSKDVSDDLRSYHEQVQDFAQLSFDIIDALADLAIQEGDNDGFYQAISSHKNQKSD